MKSVWSLLSVILVVSLASVAWAGMLPGSDVVWTTQYLGDVMPASASPAWAQSINWGYQPDHGYVSSDGDILTHSTWTPAGVASFNIGPAAWSGNTDSTVEFRMRVVDVAAGQVYASQMLYGFPRGGNADYRWGLKFGVDRVSDGSNTGNASDYMVDLTQWHTFRVLLYAGTTELPGGKIELYDLDAATLTEVKMLDSLPDGLTYDKLAFGDLFSGSIGGTTDWDYIAWTNAGAFVPIPEPMTMLLLSVGFVNVLRRRGR